MTSKIQLRTKANSTITHKEIDDNIACKVTIKFEADEKKNKVIVKHSTARCKALAFKQARSYLRKFNVTASLAKRTDLTLTHRVVKIKVNDKQIKANAFVYTVTSAQAKKSDKEATKKVVSKADQIKAIEAQAMSDLAKEKVLA